MKKWSRFVSVAIVLLLAVGIGGASGSGAAAAAGKIVLKLWHPDTREDNIRARNAVMEDFKAQHPDVSFEVTTTDWNLLYPKLQAVVAADTAPDVYFLDQPALVYGAAVNHLIVPVTDAIKKAGGENTWPKTMLSAVSFDGEIWGVPLHSVPQLIWYRKDLFQEKGLRPPITLDALLTAAQKLNDPPRLFGTALHNDAPDPEIVIEILSSYGSNLFNEKGDITLNTPESVRALEYLKKLWLTTSPDAITKSDLDMRLVFDTGAAAIMMTTISELTDFTKPQTKIKYSQVAAVPIPNLVGKLPDNPAKFTSLVIPRGAKNVEAAKEFLEFWSSYPESLKFAQLTVIGHIPVVKSVFAKNSPFWTTPRIAPFAAALRAAADANAKDGFIPGMYPKPNACGPKILAAGLYTQMASHLVVDGWDAQRAASWAQEESQHLCGR